MYYRYSNLASALVYKHNQDDRIGNVPQLITKSSLHPRECLSSRFTSCEYVSRLVDNGTRSWT